MIDEKEDENKELQRRIQEIPQLESKLSQLEISLQEQTSLFSANLSTVKTEYESRLQTISKLKTTITKEAFELCEDLFILVSESIGSKSPIDIEFLFEDIASRHDRVDDVLAKIRELKEIVKQFYFV